MRRRKKIQTPDVIKKSASTTEVPGDKYATQSSFVCYGACSRSQREVGAMIKEGSSEDSNKNRGGEAEVNGGLREK